MADNVDITAVDPTIGKDATVAADVILDVAFQRVKLTLGADGVNDGDASASNPIPVTGSVDTGLSQPLTDAQLRATPLDVNTVDSTLTTLGADAVKLVHDPDIDTGGAIVTVLGSQGVPLTQNEKGGEEFGLNSLFVRDLDLQTVLGTQSLLSLGRLKVEGGYQEQIIQGVLRTATAGMEVMFSCEGFNSLTIQLTPAQASAWTGTVTFEASLDTQAWYAMNFMPNVVAVPASTATVSGIYRFNVSGFIRFRVRCSTAGTLNAFVLAKLSTAPGVSPLNSPVTGSQAVSLSQKATTFELNTYDTNIAAAVGPVIGQLKDALQMAETWNSNAAYQIGDTFFWNGQIYRCILTTTAITPIPLPSNTTYFVVDQRQSKSLVTKDLVSPANSPRLRVEIDWDDYQIRMAEETLLITKLAMQNQMVAQEYQTEALQAGVSNGIYYGKLYAAGSSGISSSQQEEIR